MGAKHNVADALFSKVQQRVLGLLFGQPDRVFYTNEIIRLTQSGTGAVQRELANLAAVGLVLINRSGNQKQYQANKASFIFPELHTIVLKTFGFIDVLREALDSAALQLRVAFIYGSVAKGEDTVSSDIDVMLIGEGLSYSDIYPLLEGAQTKLGRQINPTFYTSEEWSRKQSAENNFINRVIDQPKIFIKGSEHDLVSLG